MNSVAYRYDYPRCEATIDVAGSGPIRCQLLADHEESHIASFVWRDTAIRPVTTAS